MTAPVSMAGALVVVESLKADLAKAIRERDDARSERDDAHMSALKACEASVMALRDVAAYKADRESLADLVDDLEAENIRLQARLDELDGEA